MLGSLAILNIAQSIIINLGLLSGTMYCGQLVVTGKLNVGEFVQFITYMVQLYVPLNFFGTYYRFVHLSTMILSTDRGSIVAMFFVFQPAFLHLKLVRFSRSNLLG